MSATYDETLPTQKDQARVLLGDTDVTPEDHAFMSDEHINAVISKEGTLEKAVAFLAQELIIRFSQEPIKISAQDGSTIDLTARIPELKRLIQTMDSVSNAGALQFVPVTYGTVETDEFARWQSYF